jgi:hypothetical protein
MSSSYLSPLRPDLHPRGVDMGGASTSFWRQVEWWRPQASSALPSVAHLRIYFSRHRKGGNHGYHVIGTVGRGTTTPSEVVVQPSTAAQLHDPPSPEPHQLSFLLPWSPSSHQPFIPWSQLSIGQSVFSLELLLSTFQMFGCTNVK